MRIGLVVQEEPVYFGPFLRRIIEERPKEFVVITIAGSRGAGGHPKTPAKKLEHLYLLWLLLEADGFLRNGLITLWQKCIKCFGLTGARFDQRSIEGMARKQHIPVIHAGDIHSPEFVDQLRQFSLDVILNQSDLLLKEEILKVPKIGTMNRHGSLLPLFRGRLASFWSHAQENPEYGITIHFVDKKIDSGPIICQKKLEIDPRLSYGNILDLLFAASSSLVLEALDQINRPGFSPLANHYEGTPTYLFPTLRDVKRYRELMKRRRGGKPASDRRGR